MRPSIATTLILAGLIGLTGLGACSSQGRRDGPRGFDREGAQAQLSGPVMGAESAARMIDVARTLRRDQGCAEAVPVYRVIASYGQNFEVAQHELAECLLAAEGDPLDRREALVWLERAAMAGHLASQYDLAEISYQSGDFAEALGWGLVFNTRNENALVPRSNFSANFLTQSRNRLSADEVSQAEGFAAAFSPQYMAAFKLGNRRPEREDMPDDGVERIRR